MFEFVSLRRRRFGSVTMRTSDISCDLLLKGRQARGSVNT
jgi:hypothetical protein